MALVPNCPPGLRVYKPSFTCEYPLLRKQAEHRSRLLHKIHSSYRKALERLRPRVRPGMAAHFLDGGGFCLGLLDPVSNVIANTLVSYGRAGGGGGGPVPGDCDELVYIPEEKLRDLERRSLDGMVTFLTRLFPYLAECEAVRFLLFADADLLVAAQIVALDLGLTRFGSSEAAAFKEAFVMALKCAALVAKHPNPDRLIADWLAISSRADETVGLLEEVHRRSPASSLDKLAKLLDGLPLPANGGHEDLWGLWCHLVASRLPPPRSVPYRYSPAMMGTLQDAIHGYYLMAIARLPAGELRSRFHRSLLEGGHCYGPFDPVSNIIVNTIWYDAAFPPAVKLELDIIGTYSLHRTENRSLYGMVSFLCTKHHQVDFHGAVHRLAVADGILYLADRYIYGVAASNFTVPTCPLGVDSCLEEAFLAAATAAHHPKPEAQAKLLFLCSRQPTMLRAALSLLQGDGQLSSEDVQSLARLLCPEATCSEQPFSSFPVTDYSTVHLRRLFKKINAALSIYDVMPNGEPKYVLQTICGVNEYVSGPVGTIAKCYRSHVNFLAIPNCPQFPAIRKPMLFFAEVSNDDKDTAGTQPFCCLVVPLPCAERARCLYCDHMGIRIVHPTGKDFHGRKLEFEKMVCGEDPCNDDFVPEVMQPYYTNINIIEHSRITSQRVNGKVKEDHRYFVPCGHNSDLSSMADEYPIKITSCCRRY